MEENRESSNGSHAEFFNAYSIHNTENLNWHVATYTFVQVNGNEKKPEKRGKITEIMWNLRRQYRDLCRGYGFIIQVDSVTVAIPQKWEIPAQDNLNGYRIIPTNKFQAQASNPETQHRVIVAGILRESIKTHFKSEFSDEIGPLWQDYRDFCQIPDLTNIDRGIVYCRKFHVSPELLENGLWTLQVEVTTKSLDARPFADYYDNGEVRQLAEMIKLKRQNRLTRENTPPEIRVWRSQGADQAEVLELHDPETIIGHALLDPIDQIALATESVPCRPYNKSPISIPLNEIRLIPEAEIAQEYHRETIIDPNERTRRYGKLRDFLDGMNAHGKTINLAEQPLDSRRFCSISLKPPAVGVKASPGGISLIPAPKDNSPQELEKRRRRLVNHVRKHGYLQQRPINPLFAYHKTFGEERARRMRTDLNWSVAQQHLDFKFEERCGYSAVHDIQRKVNQGNYDALFVVLPEAGYEKHSDGDTHEKVKKAIPIPSQCIHHDNTLPKRWANQSWKEFQDADRRKARYIQDRYNQCILNLLVKHHWVPFAPADSFHYNVHIGIDVGGQHNNRAMICIGYGFSKPSDGLTFLLKEVNVQTQKVEPIPADYLYDGLLSGIDELSDGLKEAGVKNPDFNRTLFFRDGELGGQGDHWNEKDALHKARRELRQREWIDDDALWTAIEVSKRAAHWRVLHNNRGAVRNPTVGRCLFPFADKNTAIICTTGDPYLPAQGTASPLRVRIIDVYRTANPEEALRDFFWETDMCFTKIDTGMKLPWVLHVANRGALQLSKAYKISGVTV